MNGCHCVFGGCLCSFARRTKYGSLFLLCSLRQKSVRTKIGWCRLVDGHLANEGKFSVHVFFYSWLMPSKNRKSRHFRRRWLVDDDDSVAALAHDCARRSIRRFVAMREGNQHGTQTVKLTQLSCRLTFRISFLRMRDRSVTAKRVFCVSILGKVPTAMYFTFETILGFTDWMHSVHSNTGTKNKCDSRCVNFWSWSWSTRDVGCEFSSHSAKLFSIDWLID